VTKERSAFKDKVKANDDISDVHEISEVFSYTKDRSAGRRTDLQEEGHFYT
jgi:hypothetical protein